MLVRMAVSKTACLQTVATATVNSLCWRRHFCGVFIREVLSSVVRCDG